MLNNNLNLMIENNYAFIDSQNVNLAIRDLGWKLDYRKFRIYLKEKYQVTKAYIFIGYMPKNRSLYSSLEDRGYVLVFKPTLEFYGGKVKGNVDGELILQAAIEYNNYDKAVIISGDGDFYCIVDYLNKHNKLKRLIVPNSRKYSGLLKPFAIDKIEFMNQLKNRLEYKPSKN